MKEDITTQNNSIQYDTVKNQIKLGPLAEAVSEKRKVGKRTRTHKNWKMAKEAKGCW